MLDFQQKRKIRRLMYHWVTLILLTILVLFTIHSTWVVYQKKRTSQEMKDISLQNVEELRLRNEELKWRIERLQTSPGIEEEIRSKFTVAKDKENMVIVVDNQSQNISTTSQKMGFWQKVWNFINR